MELRGEQAALQKHQELISVVRGQAHSKGLVCGKDSVVAFFCEVP